MASPDKTPLERLSWLQRQSVKEPVVIVREADLAALEARVRELTEAAWDYLAHSTDANHDRLCRAIGRPDAVLNSEEPE